MHGSNFYSGLINRPLLGFWIRNMKNMEEPSIAEDIRCVEPPISFLSNLSLDEKYEEREKTIKWASQASPLPQTVIYFTIAGC